MEYIEDKGIIIVYGGLTENLTRNGASKQFISEVNVLDLETLVWRILPTELPNAERYGHCSAISKSNMYIFGGCNQKTIEGDVELLQISINFQNQYILKLLF